MVLARKDVYPDIDSSYYLSGDAGQLSAFEEYAVRKLTKDVLTMDYQEIITDYLKSLV